MSKSMKILEVIKSLVAAYIFTGAALAVLAFVIYKWELSETVVNLVILAIYVLASLLGWFDRKEGERAEIHLGTDHGNVLYIDTIWGIYDYEKQPEYDIYGRCIGGSTLYRRWNAWRNAELRLS